MVKALTIGGIIDKIDCKAILYEDMHKINTIDELLPCTLILYQLAHIGHFCCVFENKEGINFFDPMGKMIDASLKYVKFNKKDTHHDFTYLIKLFLNSNKKVIYNEYAYQKAGTMTCGYWCALRMLFSYLTNEEFHDIFKVLKFKDDKIVKLYNII